MHWRRWRSSLCRQQPSNNVHGLTWTEWLRQTDIARPQRPEVVECFGPPRREHHGQIRIPCASIAGHVDTAEPSRHMDICQQQIKAVLPLQRCHGLFAVAGFNDIEVGFMQGLGQKSPNQRFILDQQNTSFRQRGPFAVYDETALAAYAYADNAKQPLPFRSGSAISTNTIPRFRCRPTPNCETGPANRSSSIA